MDNPYSTSLFAVGILSGLVAGFIPARRYKGWIVRLFVLASGACVSWWLNIRFVEWAYSHPFNPDDGGPMVMVGLFGWLMALIWPILPNFLAIIVCRWAIGRFTGRRKDAA